MASPRAFPFRAYVGANVQRLRRKNKLTQEQLAERAGIEARYIRTIERGQTNLTLDVLVRLAEVLGVDPRLLLRPADLEPARPGRPPRRRPTR